MDQLPNRIRELRKAKDWKLEELADRVGISVTFMSDLERGVRDLGFVWLKRVAKALRVKPGDLLNAEDNSASLSAAQHELIALYAQADEAQRQQFLGMAKLLLAKPGGKKAA